MVNNFVHIEHNNSPQKILYKLSPCKTEAKYVTAVTKLPLNNQRFYI